MISNAAKKYNEVGKILNLMTLDANFISNFATMYHSMWVSPLVIFVGLALVIAEIGVVGLIGFAIIVMSYVLQIHFNKKMLQYRRGVMMQKDIRSKLINEYIEGVRVLKYYGWEPFAEKTIFEVRKKEIKTMIKAEITRAVNDFFSNVIPILISIGIFGAYVAMGNKLTPAKAFTVQAYFKLLNVTISMITIIDANSNVYGNIYAICTNKSEHGKSQSVFIK